MDEGMRRAQREIDLKEARLGSSGLVQGTRSVSLTDPEKRRSLRAPHSFQIDLSLRVYSDDGVRLWVNGELIIDNWTAHSPAFDTGTISLVAGQMYDIRLEYYENGGEAAVTLEWRRPGLLQFELVPRSQLRA